MKIVAEHRRPGGRSRSESLALLFNKCVEKDSNTGCWIYTLSVNWWGYGSYWTGQRTEQVHRFVYEELRGPIPSGLTLDHLCNNTRCVNPDHLEPATAGENSLRGTGPAAQNKRKTHCKRGHPFDEENTYLTTNSRHGGVTRNCRACRAAYAKENATVRNARRRARRRAA